MYLGKSPLEFWDIPGQHASVLVLENQEAWVLRQSAGAGTVPVLFGQGQFAFDAASRVFSAAKALVAISSSELGELPMTLSGPDLTRLTAVVPSRPSGYRPPAMLATPATGYEYNKPARIPDVSGAWKTQTLGGSFTVDDTGAVTATKLAGGCSLAGTFTPRPSGKNVFNVNLTVADCASAGNYSGVAVGYLDFDFGAPFTVPTLRLMAIEQDNRKVFAMTLPR